MAIIAFNTISEEARIREMDAGEIEAYAQALYERAYSSTIGAREARLLLICRDNYYSLTNTTLQLRTDHLTMLQ